MPKAYSNSQNPNIGISISIENADYYNKTLKVDLANEVFKMLAKYNISKIATNSTPVILSSVDASVLK